MRSATGFVLNQELSRILFYPDFVLRSTGKAIGDHGIKWEGKTLLDLDYADDLSILDESVSKMNEVLEVLRVQGAKIGLKNNIKKTKLLRLGIKGERMKK